MQSHAAQALMIALVIAVIIGHGAGLACAQVQGPGATGTLGVVQNPRRIEIPGVGPNGIFDPSLTEDAGGRIWMSYSEVAQVGSLRHISTRIGFSDDQGETWGDVGFAVNPATPIDLPAPNEGVPAVWNQEVSRLLYDPYDVPERRWKLLWHRFLNIFLDGQPVRLFDNGWIALKTAASAEGPWSDERKLFVGSIYNEDLDGDAIGPPEFRLDRLFPGPEAMGDCVTFSEPGMLATPEGIYITLKCPLGAVGGKIVLLKCDRSFSACDFLGIFAVDSEASAFNPAFNGFSATELVQSGGDIFLFLTPTEGPAKLYRGCYVFRVADLEGALLERNDGKLVPALNFSGAPGSFNGACGFTPGAVQSGILYSQVFLSAPLEFRVFASGLFPPLSSHAELRDYD